MKFSESEKSGFQDREEIHFPGGVHIRQEHRGVMMYAVFDGEEQVSEEAGPLGDDYIIDFAKGYSACKKRYE